MSVSERIKARLIESNKPFSANDNIRESILPEELYDLEEELADKMQAVLDALVIDTQNDHNTKDTAHRVARMMLRETFSGRYLPRPEITEFPNAKELDELYTVGPIHVNSTCSHHLVPIVGKLWIGVQPGESVVGLSKFHRLANWVFNRPQIQEEMTIQLADELENIIKPIGLALVFKATHFCTSCRGVKDPGTVMTTSVVRGSLRESPSLKAEFLQLIRF